MIDLILDYALKFAGIGFAYFVLHRVVSKKAKEIHIHIGFIGLDFDCSFYKKLSAESWRRDHMKF